MSVAQAGILEPFDLKKADTHTMRRYSRTATENRTTVGQPATDSHLWRTLNSLAPYLWQYKWRVLLALSCLFTAKVANVTVPLVFKEMIDGLTGTCLLYTSRCV